MAVGLVGRMSSTGLFIAKALAEISAAVYCTVGLCRRLTWTELAGIQEAVTGKKLALESMEQELIHKQDKLYEHASIVEGLKTRSQRVKSALRPLQIQIEQLQKARASHPT
jgi:hypothetical protein